MDDRAGTIATEESRNSALSIRHELTISYDLLSYACDSELLCRGVAGTVVSSGASSAFREIGLPVKQESQSSQKEKDSCLSNGFGGLIGHVRHACPWLRGTIGLGRHLLLLLRNYPFFLASDHAFSQCEAFAATYKMMV